VSDEHTPVSDATKQAEAQEAEAGHVADRAPTPEEEQEVEGAQVDPDVRAHYQEMAELGADDVGEGRIP
jgi:hypothetical protein